MDLQTNGFNSLDDEVLYYLNLAVSIRNGIITTNKETQIYYRKIYNIKFRANVDTKVVSNIVKDYLKKQECSEDLVESIWALICKA